MIHVQKWGAAAAKDIKDCLAKERIALSVVVASVKRRSVKVVFVVNKVEGYSVADSSIDTTVLISPGETYVAFKQKRDLVKALFLY